MTAKVLWFTGLSGSGKTTIAHILADMLKANNKRVKIIDGDVVRNTLTKHLGFSKDDIIENNRIIAGLCADNSENYDYILVPLISPLKEARSIARSEIGMDFIEIFINTPIEECIRRDVKGLYKKALAGDIKNFIGISKETPYENPENPDIEIKTVDKSPKQCAEEVLKRIL